MPGKPRAQNVRFQLVRKDSVYRKDDDSSV